MREWFIKTVVRRCNSRPGRTVLEWYQDYLLRKTIHHAALHSPFYQRKFAELGLSPADMQTQDDLPKLDFFTTGADLQADPFDFLAVPKAKIVHIMSTAGTSGQPKLTFYSKRDWDGILTRMHVGFVLMGIDEDTVHQIMFCAGTPTWMGGSLLQAGLARRGCMIVPKGNMPSPEEQLEAIRTFGTTYLYGTPSYVYRVTEEGKNLADLPSLGIKSIYLGGEPNSKAFRNYLEQVWGAKVYDGYGMMEMGAGVGGECPEQDGLHIDLYILVEVIDPATGSPVELGQIGELVFTTLNREATPLIRYRSGDVGCLLPNEPCPCGLLPTRKISNILGRTDDLIFLGTAENFYPNQLDKAMVNIEGVAGYQMVVGKEGYKDTLLLRVETASPSPALNDRVITKLYEAIPFIRHDVQESQTIARPLVEFLPLGALHRQNPIKVRKVVDTRDSVPASADADQAEAEQGASEMNRPFGLAHRANRSQARRS